METCDFCLEVQLIAPKIHHLQIQQAFVKQFLLVKMLEWKQNILLLLFDCLFNIMFYFLSVISYVLNDVYYSLYGHY